MSGVVKATSIVRRFYVFCPRLGQKEGEEAKKLLFYYPAADQVDFQVQTIGFTEAIIGFAGTFSGKGEDNEDYFEIGTDKDLQVCCRVETDFFIGVVCSKQSAAEFKYPLRAKVLHSVLMRMYSMFRLFFGKFQLLMSGLDATCLMERLEYFCHRYLLSLRLQQLPLLDLLDGVRYMTIDSSNYLSIQTLINRISEEYPFVAHTLFLCNDRLLWYTVAKPDLLVLYRYLVQNLLPMSLRNELQPESRRDSSSSTTAVLHYGKFVTGVGAANEPVGAGSFSTKEVKMPFVHVLGKDNESDEQHYLIAYRILNSTLILLIPVGRASVFITSDFYERFDSFAGPQMASAASALVELYNKDIKEDGGSGSGPPHQYVYYNRVNCSLLSTFSDRNPLSPSAATNTTSSVSSTGLPQVPYEMYGVLTDLREELINAEYFGDVIAKSDDDYWVAAKKSDEREVFALIYQKNANLTEIHEEMRKLCSAKFEGKFLLE